MGGRGLHLGGRRPWWRRPVVAAGAAVVVLGGAGGVAYAVTRGPSAAQVRARTVAHEHAVAVAEAAAVRSEQAQLVSGITVAPAPGATSVALDAPVTVTATQGTISAVKVAAASGSALAGALAPDGTKWTSTGALAPTTTYTVTVAVDRQGVTATHTSTFTTLTPAATVSAHVYPTEGMTVGVGQPVVVTFSHDIPTADRTAVEARFTVAESQPVAGGWYWFNDYEMHLRPAQYWPAHETIKVTADLSDMDLGANQWLGGTISDTYAIGDARISYANLQTERMVVTLNGQTVYTFPISGGRPKYPTMGGDHIVLDRQSVVHMLSSTVGIPVHSPDGYDEYVYNDVHISDSGEYVHAAPWSVAAQGVTNVSHGCINISTADSKTFFDFSRVGDVVEVAGSPRPPAYGDHGVMDWSTPFSQWAPAHVVSLSTGAPVA